MELSESADGLSVLRGGSTVGVSITREPRISQMAELVRVDNGEGKGILFQFSKADADAFIRANPRAFVVGPRPVRSDQPTPAEVAATALVERTPVDGDAPPAKRKLLSELTLPDLLALAQTHGIALTDGAKKADVFKALKEANITPDTLAPTSQEPDLEAMDLEALIALAEARDVELEEGDDKPAVIAKLQAAAGS